MSAWLVVGLGNPGPTYAFTRHNVGFFTVDELAKRAGASWSAPRGMRTDACETRATASGMGGVGADSTKVVLLKPRTFMNDSGIAVKKACDFFKIDPAHVIVVHDELDIEFDTLRIKLGGGDNGHNGLKSIRAHLGTGEFYRVRYGIGRPPGRQPAADYVLAQIPASQREGFALATDRAADAVEHLLFHDLASTQNRFNS